MTYMKDKLSSSPTFFKWLMFQHYDLCKSMTFITSLMKTGQLIPTYLEGKCTDTKSKKSKLWRIWIYHLCIFMHIILLLRWHSLHIILRGRTNESVSPVCRIYINHFSYFLHIFVHSIGYNTCAIVWKYYDNKLCLILTHLL